MNKRKEEMLNYLKQVADLSITDLKELKGYEDYEIVDVQYCGEVERTNRKTGEKVILPRVNVIAADKNNKELTTQSTYIGLEELDIELLKEYEIAENIRDEVGEKTREDERYSLRELEEEKSKEKEETNKEDDKKKKESDKRNTAKKVKKIIAIYGIWTKDPSNEGVFICEPINVGQVFCAEEKFYE